MLRARRRHAEPFQFRQRVDPAIHAAVGTARTRHQQLGQIGAAMEMRELDHAVAPAQQGAQRRFAGIVVIAVLGQIAADDHCCRHALDVGADGGEFAASQADGV
ncbi:hypothetical protein D9M73_290520 [compost metagenome]